MNVRLGVRADVDAVLGLFDDVSGELVYIGTEPGYDRDLYRARFLQMIAQPEETPLFVAMEGPVLVGTLSVFIHAESGPTIGMMVAADRRGRGLGRALLEAAFDWARSHHIPALSLLVFPHNQRAVALYRKAGFIEIERYERDVVRRNGEVWDTMLMRKEIS